ncbi:Alpha/Beta hydrolase protein [Coniochaeta sp. 2T2.1]|nr:Alpha/Beta hydrolase protein [Coniochaeta sp. 2T2.1]
MGTTSLPMTIPEILTTGTIDPAFETAWISRGSPPGVAPAPIPALSAMVASSLPQMQSALAASRPSSVIETEHTVLLSTGFRSRVLVCSRTGTATATAKAPVILLFHGGGGCLGFPELELPLARRLAADLDAVVVLPSYRLAPQHPFPAGVQDAWAAVQLLRPDPDTTLPIPPHADPAGGFMVGGSSSGANMAGVLARLARDERLHPALTGQVLVCGAWLDPGRVPEACASRYLSREQNAEAPVLTQGFVGEFLAAYRPDEESALWAPLSNPREGDTGLGVGGLPPGYFQVCGMDVNRDDGLIYERALREEAGVATRMDLYGGWPHCFWDAYPELEMSERRAEDYVKGVRWLLGQRKGSG